MAAGWAVTVQVSVQEVGRPFGLNEDVVLRAYTFQAPTAKGSSLLAAWTKVENEIHEGLLAKLEPALEGGDA